MNLSEAFRYQNFLDQLLTTAGHSIGRKDHCLETIKHHHISDAVPEFSDKTEIVAVDEFPSNDMVLKFMEMLIHERQKVTDAIGIAKSTIPFDLDAAIATNKFRQRFCSSVKEMMYYKTDCKTELAQGYKFNAEGNQAPFNYNVDVVTKYRYDVENAKKMYKDTISKADNVSSEIENALVNTVLDFIPTFNVNDTFEDIMETLTDR